MTVPADQGPLEPAPAWVSYRGQGWPGEQQAASRGLGSSGHREPEGEGQLAGGQSPPSPEAAAQDHGEAPGELGPGSHSSGLE